MRRPFFAIIAVLALSACNTMLYKQYQVITVDTPGVAHADCFLENKGDKYHMIAPGTVTVERSRHQMTVICDKTGYLTGRTVVDSKVRMAGSQLNVFNGLIPGTAYDVASNSIYDYPDLIIVQMAPDPNAIQPVSPEIIMLQKKPEVVKPAQPAAAEKAKTEKSLSNSLKK